MNFLFGFSGRIGRLQWWLGQLASVVVLTSVLLWIGGTPATSHKAHVGFTIFVLIGSYVVMVWINLAVSVKRYHDRDKPWPWVLVMLIPVVGGIWQLVECGFLSGSPGRNTYGDPAGGSGGSMSLSHERLEERASGRDDAIIERWTTVVSVTEKVTPKSAGMAAKAAGPGYQSTGPATFGRRGV